MARYGLCWESAREQIDRHTLLSDTFAASQSCAGQENFKQYDVLLKGVEVIDSSRLHAVRDNQVLPAIQYGFLPDSISTDLHIGSMNAGMKDMINVMSKFLNMGLTLPDVITW
jgi:hypothetical protein